MADFYNELLNIGLAGSNGYNINYSPTVEDGDTISGITGLPKRIMGYDAFEIPHPGNLQEEEKANKLAALGLSKEEQYRRGLLGTERVKQLLQDPTYSQFSNPTSFDVYGRPLVSNEPLAEEMIRSLNAVPMDKFDQKKQELYRRSIEKQYEFGLINDNDIKALEIQRQYNIDRPKSLKQSLDQFLKDAGEPIDAFQAGLTKLGADTLDAAVDLTVGNLVGDTALGRFTNEIKDQKAIDKWVGYDRRGRDFNIDEAYHKLQKANVSGNFTDYLDAIRTVGVGTALEIFAESIPMMVGMGTGVGFSAVLAGQINNRLDERKVNNNGRSTSASEFLAVAAEETAALALDRFAFNKTLGLGTKGATQSLEALKEVTKEISTEALPNLFVRAGKAAGRVGISAGAEGIQEGIQNYMNDLGAQYGTDKYGTEVFTAERDMNAVKGVLGGMAAGGVGRGSKEAMDAAKYIVQEKSADSESSAIKDFKEKLDNINHPDNMSFLKDVANENKIYAEESYAVNEQLGEAVVQAKDMNELTTVIDTLVEQHGGKVSELSAIKDNLDKEYTEAVSTSVVQKLSVEGNLETAMRVVEELVTAEVSQETDKKSPVRDESIEALDTNQIQTELATLDQQSTILNNQLLSAQAAGDVAAVNNLQLEVEALDTRKNELTQAIQAKDQYTQEHSDFNTNTQNMLATKIQETFNNLIKGTADLKVAKAVYDALPKADTTLDSKGDYFKDSLRGLKAQLIKLSIEGMKAAAKEVRIANRMIPMVENKVKEFKTRTTKLNIPKYEKIVSESDTILRKLFNKPLTTIAKELKTISNKELFSIRKTMPNMSPKVSELILAEIEKRESALTFVNKQKSIKNIRDFNRTVIPTFADITDISEAHTILDDFMGDASIQTASAVTMGKTELTQTVKLLTDTKGPVSEALKLDTDKKLKAKIDTIVDAIDELLHPNRDKGTPPAAENKPKKETTSTKTTTDTKASTDTKIDTDNTVVELVKNDLGVKEIEIGGKVDSTVYDNLISTLETLGNKMECK